MWGPDPLSKLYMFRTSWSLSFSQDLEFEKIGYSYPKNYRGKSFLVFNKRGTKVNRGTKLPLQKLYLFLFHLRALRDFRNRKQQKINRGKKATPVQTSLWRNIQSLNFGVLHPYLKITRSK